MNDRDVVIVEAVRTATGRRNGSLSGIHPVVLLSQALNEVMRRAGLPADVVEDVVCGCVDQIGEQAANIGRNAMLAAGFPYTIPGAVRIAPETLERDAVTLVGAGAVVLYCT